MGFVDANHDVPRSTTGYIFKLFGNTISWASIRQTLVALSSSGAEWDALHEAAKEARYLRHLAAFLGLHMKNPLRLYEDNAAVIKWTTRELTGQFKRRKFLELRTMFVIEACSRGWIEVVGVKSCNNIADFFTKILAAILQQKFMKYILLPACKLVLPHTNED